VGTYTSAGVLCIYLESDAPAAAAAASTGANGGAAAANTGTAGAGERSFWVKSRCAVLNARWPERTAWKESAICTKTWNNSVLQLAEARAGDCSPPEVYSACRQPGVGVHAMDVQSDEQPWHRSCLEG
jgi:hypothetical protein